MARHRLTPRQLMALNVAFAVLSGAAGVYRDLHVKIDEAWLVPASRQVYAAVQVIGAVVVVWRRLRPKTVGLLTAGLSLVSPIQGAPAVLYSIAVHGRPRVPSWAVMITLWVVFFVGGRLWRADDPVSSPVLLAFGAVLGLYLRERRSLQDALVDQQIRSAREQVLLARQVAADERTRLASEMHDVVSNRLNLVVLQAGALASTTADPEVSTALEELRANGVAALTELREVFALVRAGAEVDTGLGARTGGTESSATGGTAAAPPGTAMTEDLGALVDQWRSAGMQISLRHRVPETAATPVDPILGRTGYRIVQEGLTNAAKHAPGAAVDVEITLAGSELGVSVSNETGGPPTDQVQASGSGLGLAGLTQRVALLGGSLSAGPRPDGGFQVTARLPVRAGRD